VVAGVVISGARCPADATATLASVKSRLVFTTRRYVSTAYAMGLCLSVCLCVCHKLVFY